MAINRRTRDGRWVSVRPSFNYPAPNEDLAFNVDSCIAQISEDSRNVLEQIRDSQMLQGDIAAAIKDIAKQLRGLRRDLKGLRK